MNLEIGNELNIQGYGRCKILDIFYSRRTQEKLYRLECMDDCTTIILEEADLNTGEWSVKDGN